MSYEAPKALAAERPLSKTNKDRDHFEYFLAFLKRFQIIVSCNCKNYKSGLVRATLRHDLPPQFLLLFRSKFKKREKNLYKNKEKFIGIRKDTVILVGQCINVRYSYTCVSD